MEQVLKRYTIGAKVFVVLLLVSLFWTTSALWNVVFATDLVRYKFDCDNISLDISRNGNAPLVATIGTEAGLWVEVPPDKPEDVIFFYNIATSKIAKFSAAVIGGVKVPILQIYRDMDFYQTKTSQMNLRCRKHG